MDEKVHDDIRGRKRSWKRAIEGLKHVQDVGMDPYLNITVGHYNAFNPDFEELLKYSKQQNKNAFKCCCPSRYVAKNGGNNL